MKTNVWKWPPLSRKAHFFPDGARSACAKWLFTGPPEKEQGTKKDSPGKQDCLSCWRHANAVFNGPTR